MGEGRHNSRRAFDKAIRTKPPVVAVDAGLMQFELSGGKVSRCAGTVRRGATKKQPRMGRPSAPQKRAASTKAAINNTLGFCRGRSVPINMGRNGLISN